MRMMSKNKQPLLQSPALTSCDDDEKKSVFRSFTVILYSDLLLSLLLESSNLVIISPTQISYCEQLLSTLSLVHPGIIRILILIIIIIFIITMPNQGTTTAQQCCTTRRQQARSLFSTRATSLSLRRGPSKSSSSPTTPTRTINKQ